MFELTQRTASLGVPMCAPLGFGTCAEGTYSLFEWIDGVELEAALADLPDVEQYVYGVQAGEILQKIHSIPAPDNVPDWAERFNAKASRKIEIFRSCPIHSRAARRSSRISRKTAACSKTARSASSTATTTSAT